MIQKLDYIQSLNVNTLWLLPFYPSPLRDDGYDIAEYESVHPQYGTIEDFQRLLDEAHARNIRVITELVINHTSDQHAWFQRARTSPRGSPERDWYVWSDDPTKYKDARIIFTDTEVSNWTWDPVAEQFFWHRFFSHQPDLNFDNPEVLAAVIEVMRFWFRMGVDGMRLDAIPYLIERDGTNCENLPETHEVLKEIRAALDAEFENKLLLAEANQWPTRRDPVLRRRRRSATWHSTFRSCRACTWRSARRIAADRRDPRADAARFRTTASGRSSSATTMSSRSRW